MLQSGRLPQSLLFYGPAGVGKATLARRLAAVLLGDPQRVERDDLSLPDNQALLADREKLSSTQRAEDPLVVSSHPDFLTFPPDGPLGQISIQQMRLLKQQAQFAPLEASCRVFLVDQADRMNEQAANSLLKVLEEPPEHLVLILTAENYYDLLPTIRSRVVPFYLAPLPEEQVREFVEARGLDQPERRAALADGCPGRAVRLDLNEYDRRRDAMLILLEAAAAGKPFSDWAAESERLSAARIDKLEPYLEVLQLLVEDILRLACGDPVIHHREIQPRLQGLARRVDLRWTQQLVAQVEEIRRFLRRNIQKAIALDALVLKAREQAAAWQGATSSKDRSRPLV